VALFPVRSNTRELNLALLSFTTDGASDPSSYVDPGGVIDFIVGPDTIGTDGEYLIQLKQSHRTIVAVANLDGADEFTAAVSSAGGVGVAVTTKEVDFVAGTVAGANTTGRTVYVQLSLQR
jgi:hypothetical protein